MKYELTYLEDGIYSSIHIIAENADIATDYFSANRAAASGCSSSKTTVETLKEDRKNGF